MLFNIDFIEGELKPHVNDNFKLRRMKFFTKEAKKAKFENKGICAIVLNCTSPTTATKAISAYNGNKKSRVAYQPNRTYHRWFLCGDVMNPPHTFAIVTHNHQQTCELLKHVHEKSFMGMPFYLIEPDLSTSRVGDYLHILESKGQEMFPVKDDVPILRKPAPIELPIGTDQTFFFVVENEKLNLTRMKVSTQTCTGYQCDRHWGKDGCVCAYGAPGNSLVYEFDFEIPVDKRQFNMDTHVASICSFRTMSVFFNNLIEYTSCTTAAKEHAHLQRRRSQIRRMIKYINENGGWKIVGWCKRGQLSIEGEAEKVENRKVNLRLTSVYPQDKKVLEHAEFKELLIGEDFELSDAQLSNLSPPSTQSDSDSDEDNDEDDDANIHQVGFHNKTARGGDEVSDNEEHDVEEQDDEEVEDDGL